MEKRVHSTTPEIKLKNTTAKDRTKWSTFIALFIFHILHVN